MRSRKVLSWSGLAVLFLAGILNLVVGFSNKTFATSISITPNAGGLHSVAVTEYYVFLNEHRGVLNNLDEFAELNDVTKQGACPESTAGMEPTLITNIPSLERESEPGYDEDTPANRKKAMLYNTWFLQALVNCASNYAEANNQNVTLSIPGGRFYFRSGHSDASGRHVIKLKSRVGIIVGHTDYEDWHFFPFLDAEDRENYTGGNYTGGLDMFYYDQNSDGGRLEGATFGGMTIDGSNINGTTYNGTGMGFRINGCDSCMIYNVTVQNMPAAGIKVLDATNSSFGMVNNGVTLKNNGQIISGVTPAGLTEMSDDYINASGLVVSAASVSDPDAGGVYVQHVTSENSENNGTYGIVLMRSNINNTAANEVKLSGNTATNNRANYAFKNLDKAVIQYNQSIEPAENENVLGQRLNLVTAGTLRNISTSGFWTAASRSMFNDNQISTNWSYDSSLWGEEDDLVSPVIGNGEINGNFGEKITLAEALTTVWKVYGWPVGAGIDDINVVWNGSGEHCGLSDNSEGRYVYAFLSGLDLADTCGVVSAGGDIDELNRAKVELSRAQMMEIIYQFAGKTGIDISVGDAYRYLDVDDVNVHYRAIMWGIGKISNGLKTAEHSNNHFQPNEPITRREMLAFLYRYSLLYGCNITTNNLDCREDITYLLDLSHNIP